MTDSYFNDTLCHLENLSVLNNICCLVNKDIRTFFFFKFLKLITQYMGGHKMEFYKKIPSNLGINAFLVELAGIAPVSREGPTMTSTA